MNDRSQKAIPKQNYILFCLLYLLLTTLHAQENKPEVALSHQLGSKWHVECNFLLGVGIKNHEVGETTENEKIKISGGGGLGGVLNLGYGITSSWDLNIGFGIQYSSLQPQVENADGSFFRTILLTTIKYRIPVSSSGIINIGTGAGYYLPDDLDVDVSKIPEGAHNIYSYKNAVGFHLQAEYEGFFNPNLTWIIGLKYYHISYDLEAVSMNGISYPISDFPAEIISELGELDGSGIDLILSLNYYF